jgi:hypothetical protein
MNLHGPRTYKSASCSVVVPDLPEHIRDQVREITHVNASERRSGHATALMYTVVAEADLSGLVLILKAEPFGDGMTQEQLLKFYGKFGFEVIQTEPCVLMQRAPQKLRIVTTH